MKSKEEIERLAKQLCNIPIDLVIDEEERYYKNLEKYDGIIQGYTQCQEDMAEKIEVNSPNPKLIDSMAMRYRHDFGLLDKQQQDSIRTTMIQLWEEVVGKGFY